MSLPKDEGYYKCACREGSKGRNCELSEHPTTIRPLNVTIGTTENVYETTATAITTSSVSTTEDNVELYSKKPTEENDIEGFSKKPIPLESNETSYNNGRQELFRLAYSDID